MSEKETRDFMSVDSFSQLPFIRSAPPVRDKNGTGASSNAAGSGIRLFGIEFPQEADVAEAESYSSKDNNSGTGGNGSGGSANGRGGAGGGDGGRKFECHYCCRNFPTSQALGGHQNAHKRERQHAKRAYLQSAMAAQHHHQAHGYGLVNYHHLGSLSSTARFSVGHAFEPPPPSHYPSWSSTGAAGGLLGARFYSGPGSVSQPINGSPLPGMWRISAVQGGGGGLLPAQRDRSMIAPLLADDESRATGGMIGVGGRGGGVTGSSSSSSSPEARLDHLSLDLHL